MTLGKLLMCLLMGLGVYNMNPDDFAPLKIWFTIPGVIVMGILIGILGDWIGDKIKRKRKVGLSS